MYIGHSEDGFAGLETALRLSPRDPWVPLYQFWICHLHNNLAQWVQAIEWCSKSIAGDSGHAKEARDAAAQLQRVYPRFTVQTWAGVHWSDDPTFKPQYQRIVRGLHKAGLPRSEGSQRAGADALLAACRLAGISALEASSVARPPACG